MDEWIDLALWVSVIDSDAADPHPGGRAGRRAGRSEQRERERNVRSRSLDR